MVERQGLCDPLKAGVREKGGLQQALGHKAGKVSRGLNLEERRKEYWQLTYLLLSRTGLLIASKILTKIFIGII